MLEESGQYSSDYRAIDRKCRRREGLMKRSWVPSHLQWDVKGGFKLKTIQYDLCFNRIPLAATQEIN